MKTILIPTDFSRNARSAALYALSMFNENDRFILLNAYSMPAHTRAGMLINLEDELKRDAVAELKKEQQEILAEAQRHVNLETYAEAGRLTTVVSYMANREKVDYVVMGTKGASNAVEGFMGSNAYDVICDVKRPIIAVPESAHHVTMKQVVFAADFNRIDDRLVLNPLVDLVNDYQATLHVVNVVAPDAKEGIEQTIERIRLKKYFQLEASGFHTIVHENVATGIERFAEEVQADLIVMLARENGFFDRVFQNSITRRMALYTKVPLLALHDR